MAKILGEDYSRNDLAMRLGHLSQLAGIRMMELRDGSEAGVRIAEVRTGSGLRFQVSLDRPQNIIGKNIAVNVVSHNCIGVCLCRFPFTAGNAG